MNKLVTINKRLNSARIYFYIGAQKNMTGRHDCSNVANLYYYFYPVIQAKIM
jgi:hypothetical protein